MHSASRSFRGVGGEWHMLSTGMEPGRSSAGTERSQRTFKPVFKRTDAAIDRRSSLLWSVRPPPRGHINWWSEGAICHTERGRWIWAGPSSARQHGTGIMSCFQAADRALRNVGSTYADVVKSWTFWGLPFTAKDFQDFNDVRAQFFADAGITAGGGSRLPSNTGVVMPRAPRLELRVLAWSGGQ